MQQGTEQRTTAGHKQSPQNVVFTSAVQADKLPDCCQPAFVYAETFVTQVRQRSSGSATCVGSVAAK